jgi:hypothetical protein
MAYITFQPHDHFGCPTWTGSSSTTTITGMEFKPDSIWIKRYDGNGHPILNNSSLGTAKNWLPSGNNAVDTTTYVASYTSDGFTLTGGAADANENGEKHVAACWKANGGTTASNSDGGTTSTVQANTTAGFSIVNWTGTGGTTTLGHGLGVAPKLIIAKNNAEADRGVTLNMSKVYVSDPETDNIQFALNSSTLQDQADRWGDTAPTSSVFTVGGTGMINGSSDECFAYCWAEKKGFSKFGYYKGNGDVDGSFIYCGFRPKWIMVKKSDTAENWFTKVTGITGYGTGAHRTRTIKYDDATSSTNCTVRFTSTGFIPITTDAKANGAGNVYWYMAFAEMPIVTSNGLTALAI